MSVFTLSGNYCTDKKPAPINWVEGEERGRGARRCCEKDLEGGCGGSAEAEHEEESDMSIQAAQYQKSLRNRIKDILTIGS
jgi:hypothetical protein